MEERVADLERENAELRQTLVPPAPAPTEKQQGGDGGDDSAAAADAVATATAAVEAAVNEGDRVLARYGNRPGSRYFPGTVTAVKSLPEGPESLAYDVEYNDDGDREAAVAAADVRPIAPLRSGG